MGGDGATLHLSVINYAEALVKPAENPTSLQQAIEAMATLRIHLHSPDAGIARDAVRLRSLNISLAGGFALATAKRLGASVASYDRRVRTAAHKEQIATT